MDNFFILETSICEIEEYISLFDECDHTSSIPELSILMNDQKRTSIRLYSSITPQIQYLIYQYPIYEDKYFQIYRTHNFQRQYIHGMHHIEVMKYLVNIKNNLIHIRY